MEDEDSLMSNGNKKRIYPVRRMLLLLVVALVFGAFMMRHMIKSHVFAPILERLTPPPKLVVEPKPRYELRTSFSNDPSTMVHQKYHSGMDACRILQQCFVGSDVYGTPEVCKRNLDPTIKYYDSGFWVEMMEGKEDRLVGFLSIHHDISYKSRSQYQRNQQKQPAQPDDYHAFIIYNVCIDEERRGQGIAKKMIPAFIDAMIKHYRLEKYAKATGKETDPKTGKLVPPLIIGLDVDLTSDTMPEAFSLYAKLGFVRWWTPCTSVAYHKWAPLIDTQLAWADERQGHGINDTKDPQGNVKKTTGLLPTRSSDFPVARMLWDARSYLTNAFNLGTGKKPNHFCMYKFYSDSYASMAKQLMEESNKP